MTDREDVPALEPIRLIESEVAIDLLERYRVGANGIGSIELAKHIAMEAAKVSTPGGVWVISKSMIDAWRAGKSSPTTQHLQSLQKFFASRRFRKVVPGVEHVWDSLGGAIALGGSLLSWHGYDASGTVADLNGYWNLCYLGKDTPRFGQDSIIYVMRVAAVSGYSYGVVHCCIRFIHDHPGSIESVAYAAPWSGFVFRMGDKYRLLLRNRKFRARELSFTIERSTLVDSQQQRCWVMKRDEASKAKTVTYKFMDLTQEDWVLARCANIEHHRKVFEILDSLGWSVLPNASGK